MGKCKYGLYRPTASRFGDILTPTGMASKSQESYIDDIIRWSLYGDDEYQFSSVWTERGKVLEQEAREKYSGKVGNEVTVPTFNFNKQHKCGCYLDGIVCDGAIEIKCLKRTNHDKIANSGIVPIKYKPQLQGSLLITNFKWIDFVAYFPGLPLTVVRVLRDDDYIRKLILELEQFNAKLEDKFNCASSNVPFQY